MFLLFFTNVELSFSCRCSWLKGEPPGTRTLAACSQKKIRLCLPYSWVIYLWNPSLKLILFIPTWFQEYFLQNPALHLILFSPCGRLVPVSSNQWQNQTVHCTHRCFSDLYYVSDMGIPFLAEQVYFRLILAWFWWFELFSRKARNKQFKMVGSKGVGSGE